MGTVWTARCGRLALKQTQFLIRVIVANGLLNMQVVSFGSDTTYCTSRPPVRTVLTPQLCEESHSEYLGPVRTASPRWVAASSYHRTQHRVATRSCERYTQSVFGRSGFVLTCAVPSHG